MNSDTDALALPFFCPIGPAVHPAAGEAERRAVAWIDRMGFARTEEEYARTVRTRSADFYARFAPYADPDRLWLAACWVYWGFAFDDARCDEGPFAADPAGFAGVAARTQRALETPGPLFVPDGYAAALHDLGERFRACATPVQLRRFHHAHQGWLAGVQWQVCNRATGRLPTLDQYLTMRLHSAGGEPTYAMLEIVNGEEVPGREMDAPAVRALTEMAICVDALDNDRHSFAHECARRQTGQNVLSVLMAEEGGTPEQALHRAVGLRDRVLCRFLELRDAVRARASAPLRRYVDDLAHGIRGNIEWAARTLRYSGGAARGAGPVRTRWTDAPLPGGRDPSGLPSIAWWWQVSG
ncbi:terpene synthase family protein [Streptomyces sp. OfavH-34-F]|uniref:terpene synthase family protein n=1 Tax=Streptomyces sp. OfavH-34-F TaxID=2917760 RepID=UPI001EF31B7A|nr:terpene synthase family protein [Streptomyces sp. OfavH-34-F]MCG7527727.1 terpene synthase family protein [Streptomyces sp. OfavH-34-F]